MYNANFKNKLSADVPEHTSYLIKHTYLNDLMSDFDISIGFILSQIYVLCTIIIWMHFFRMHQILYIMHQIFKII